MEDVLAGSRFDPSPSWEVFMRIAVASWVSESDLGVER